MAKSSYLTVKRIIALFLVSLSVLLCLFMSSCSDSEGRMESKSKIKGGSSIIGTWVTNDGSKLTFEKDGTCYESNTRDGISDNILMDYQIVGKKLKIIVSAFGMSEVHNYTFSCIDGVLTLTSLDDDEVLKYYRSKEDMLKSIKNVEYDLIEKDFISEFDYKNAPIPNIVGKLNCDYEDITYYEKGDSKINQHVNIHYEYNVAELISRSIDVMFNYRYNESKDEWHLENTGHYYNTAKIKDTWLPSVIGKYVGVNDNDKYYLTINDDYSVNLKAELKGIHDEIITNEYFYNDIRKAPPCRGSYDWIKLREYDEDYFTSYCLYVSLIENKLELRVASSSPVICFFEKL